MQICLVYDCLFPYTVGGAERWYRNLAERLASHGHRVTYLTLRQWERGEHGEIPGVRVVAVGPRMGLYAESGRRRILPPVVFGLGVLWHVLRRGSRYDVVHTASFPYFSLLASAVARPARGFRVVVDWHEVWSRGYWIEYLGRFGGRIGNAVQTLCLRVPQRTFCFSHLHARRLRQKGVRGEVTVLEGEYAGPLEAREPQPPELVVVFAGRHIPEKRPVSLVAAMARLHERVPGVRAVIFGDGPERPRVLAAIARHGLGEHVDAPGFASTERVKAALSRALCMVLPSSREGYGLVVVEAASQGVPSVVVGDSDNAAVELVEDGVNGVLAPSADPATLAAAIARIHDAGPALRTSTADWFARNARRLSLESSLERVVVAYGSDSAC